MTDVAIPRPREPVSQATLMALAHSTLVARAEFAERIGATFGGAREIDKALGFKSKLEPRDYRLRYERGGIAETIVEFYPVRTWEVPAAFVENPDPAVTTDFERVMTEMFERLDLWAYLLRTDILLGLGRFAGLLLGEPGGELESELPRGRPESLIYVQPLAEEVCSVASLVKDTKDPRFGRPEFYQVKLGGMSAIDGTTATGGIATGGTIDRRVHWTRILHVAEGLLLDGIYGKPRLRACWNYLDSLDKVVGGGAEAAWNRMDPGMQFDLDPDLKELSEDGKREMKEQIEERRHGLRRDLTTKGVKIQTLSTPVTNFGPNAAAVIDLISGTTRIPQRVLLGSELGQLASAQDRNNANDATAARQRSFGTPVLRAFADRMIEYFGVPRPKTFTVEWPKGDELTETERPAVAEKMASANQKQVLAGQPPIYTTDEIREFLDLDPLADVNPDLAEGGDDTGGDPGQELPDDAPPPSAEIAANADGEDEPEWRSVHRAADAHVEALAQSIRGAWTDGAEEIDLLALTAAIHRGDLERADQIVTDALRASDKDFTAAMSGRVLATLNEGGTAALRSARSRGGWFRANAARATGLRFEASFDTANPRAIAFADLRSSALVKEIGAETLSALRDLIGRGIREGIPPRKLAAKIRESVGLRTDQLEAIDNLVHELRTAKPGALVERFPPRPGVRTNAGFRARIPKGGATEEWVQAQANRYRKMQWNYRARTIARTETMRAANEGQRELWRQAQDSGGLPKDQMRVWIGTGDERERDAHLAMNGQVVGIDKPFSPAIEPGQEPNCRCAQGLATPEDLARVAA